MKSFLEKKIAEHFPEASIERADGAESVLVFALPQQSMANEKPFDFLVRNGYLSRYFHQHFRALNYADQSGSS